MPQKWFSAPTHPPYPLTYIDIRRNLVPSLLALKTWLSGSFSFCHAGQKIFSYLDVCVCVWRRNLVETGFVLALATRCRLPGKLGEGDNTRCNYVSDN